MRDDRPKLRVIEGGQAEKPSKKHRKDSPKRSRYVQLGLPYVEPHAIAFVDTQEVVAEQFLQLLLALKPRWIIDVRATPRLDTLMGSRRFAFELFGSMGAIYLDVFGEFTLNYSTPDANPGFWSLRLAERINQTQANGPYLFIFDDTKLLEACGRELPGVMKSVLKLPVAAASDAMQLIRVS